MFDQPHGKSILTSSLNLPWCSLVLCPRHRTQRLPLNFVLLLIVQLSNVLRSLCKASWPLMKRWGGMFLLSSSSCAESLMETKQPTLQSCSERKLSVFSKDCCGVYQGMRQHVYWWVFIRKKGTLLNFWSGIHMEKVCSCLCWGGKEDKLKAGFLVLSELWAVLQITWASLDRLWKMVAIVIPCEELNVKWVPGGWINQGLGFMD